MLLRLSERVRLYENTIQMKILILSNIHHTIWRIRTFDMFSLRKNRFQLTCQNPEALIIVNVSR